MDEMWRNTTQKERRCNNEGNNGERFEQGFVQHSSEIIVERMNNATEMKYSIKATKENRQLEKVLKVTKRKLEIQIKCVLRKC